MDPYASSRRNGWSTAGELITAGPRSAHSLDKQVPDTDNEVRWIQSYVLDEGDGTRRIICIYEAPSLEAIREHASRVGLPTDNIIPIAETVSSGPTRTERVATESQGPSCPGVRRAPTSASRVSTPSFS
jgi:hypothetical protein